MFHVTHFRKFALTALFTFAAVGPVAAAPPGFERWVEPNGEFDTQLEVPIFADEVGIIQSGLYGHLIGTPGFRPFDLEINWFKESPTVKDMLADNPPAWYTISVVEVPNEGPLAAKVWGMHFDLFASDIYWAVQDGQTRMTDIELYYRKDPYDGKVYPTYAGIWVLNEGENQSDWDFIPPMPYNDLMDVLDAVSSQWRPYDIEFALDPWGNVMGTALLAPIGYFQPIGDGEFDEYAEVPTMLAYFHADQLDDAQFDGWQLLDMEVPIQGTNQDPLVNDVFFDENLRFGIFVHVPWLFPATQTWVAPPVGGAELKSLSNEMTGQFRLIDLETIFVPGTCSKKGICEGGHNLYPSAWLSAE